MNFSVDQMMRSMQERYDARAPICGPGAKPLRVASLGRVKGEGGAFGLDLRPGALSAQEQSLLYDEGLRLLEQGCVALVLLAGGQATRMGLKEPKGFFPLTPLRKRSLFGAYCRSVAALCEVVARPIPLAIMCQDALEVERFFAEHAYWGLKKESLSFFSQSSLPLVALEGGRLCPVFRGEELFRGPDGNGGVFWGLQEAGIWDRWKSQGVEFCASALVDNVGMGPFALEALGSFARELVSKQESKKRVGVMLSAIASEDAQEKVGVMAQVEGGVKIVEYSERGAEEFFCASKASPLLGNSGAMIWSIEAVDEVLKRGPLAAQLPLHFARKNYEIDSGGGRKQKRELLKGEYFIFDLLGRLIEIAPQYRSFVGLLDRGRYFLPLKNREGEGGPDAVASALTARAKNWLVKAQMPEEILEEHLRDRRHLELDPLLSWFEGQLLGKDALARVEWKGEQKVSKSQDLPLWARSYGREVECDATLLVFELTIGRPQEGERGGSGLRRFSSGVLSMLVSKGGSS